MEEHNLFRTKSHLGSFGEFCYEKFTRQREIPIQRTGILEYDFTVSDKHCVDVKTTQGSRTAYSGMRVRENISYDLISVRNGIVKIFPDKTSPLHLYHGQTIGDLEALFTEWENDKALTKFNRRAQNVHRLNRNAIKDDLFEIFNSCDLKKIRVIFRGIVSKTRWSSSPDNLPGSAKIVRSYDITIFVQMHTDGEQEYIEKIVLLKHDMFPVSKMIQPDARQLAKGIKMVLDLEWFECKFPEYVFGDIESIKQTLSKRPELFSYHIANHP